MKIKWKVSEPPTGRYRSFERRAWPEALDENGNVIAFLACEDEYRPSRVKKGDHGEIEIYVKIQSKTEEERKKFGAIRNARLKSRAKTLEEAKELVRLFWNQHS